MPSVKGNMSNCRALSQLSTRPAQNAKVTATAEEPGHGQGRREGLPHGEGLRSALIRKKIPRMKCFMDCVFKAKIRILVLLFL